MAQDLPTEPSSPTSLGQQVMIRQREMERIREFYEKGLWVDISRFVNPRREDITEASKTNDKGRRHGISSYDGTPLGALNTWADGMQGFLVSGSWFKSEMTNPSLNEEDAVRAWLQEYDRKMYAAFERSNFYAILAEWFRDAGSIGTASLFTEEEIGSGRIVHTVIHPREVYVAENKFGEVDTVHRKFAMSARAAFQKFGNEVSDLIKRNNEKQPDKMHEFIHAVFPNKDRVFGKTTSRNKEFRSMYIETKQTKDQAQIQNSDMQVNIVRDSGFAINPYAVWRFRKSSDEIYGYSPAADAIVEVFGLNQMGKTLLQAAQKSVDPPMNVPVEMRGRVRTDPKGRNYYDDPKRIITSLDANIKYPIGAAEREELRKSIEDKFRVEFFRTFIGRTGEATATEIMAIKGEQAGLMSAQVDRLYIEGLRKVFSIVSEIEDRRGAFLDMPPIPPEIEESGGVINFVLTGPLRQAQRRITELTPINETLQILAPMADALGEEMLDIVNKDELSEIIAEAGSFPQRAINSRDKRKEIRLARQQLAAQQQAQQLMIEGAKAAPGISGPVDENSILANVAEAV